MKKIYSLVVLCCLNVAAFAQSMTATINATGAPGSFKTGYVDNAATPVRIDGDIQAHHALTAPLDDRRGWAVFDLPSILPPSATVTAVNLRFTISAVADPTPATTVGLYGYVGDLSTVTSPAAAFAGCNGNGIYTGSSFNSSSWGAVPATLTLPFNASGVGFIHTNAAGPVSIGWQSNSNSLQSYTITGETGTSATQPQLQITYNCNGVSGVTATASPTTLCEGGTLSLTSTGSGIASYRWNGPNAYTSTLANPTLPVVPASSGVYTLIATNAGGCGTVAYTTSVLVNPLPVPTGGPAQVCVGSVTTLTDSPSPGTWSSSNTAIATVGLTTGVVGGVAVGFVNTTYTINATGCQRVRTMQVLAVPGPMIPSGNTAICETVTMQLSNAVAGGVWTSGDPSKAIVSATGLVTAVSPGVVTINYANTCAPAASKTFTVNPNPGPIYGANALCSGPANSTTLSSSTPGGVWSSSNTAIATINGSGVVTGVATGSVIITYKFASTQCQTTWNVTINPTPPPITTFPPGGSLSVCRGDSIILTTGVGGTWSSVNTTLVTVRPTTGIVVGKSPGVATIKFTNSCGSSTTSTFTVLPTPLPISGIRSVCQGQTTYLTDLTTGGTWSSTNSTIAAIDVSTAFIHGNTAGVTNITYKIPNGCIATTSLTVTAAPPPSGIVGNGSVCVGQTITLSQGTGVGWWSSSNIGLATVDSFSGVVRGTGMGTVVVTYTIGTGTACNTVKSIVVNPLDPITGADSICNGATTYLADIVGGGTWSSSNTNRATIHLTSGFVNSVSPGTTLITYITPQGCTTTHNLTVIAIPPPITGDFKTCPGESTRLSNATTGGRWSSANPAIATAGSVSGNIYGVFPDTVTIFYTVKPSCSVSALVTVNPNPSPITGTNGICATTYDTVFSAPADGVWDISPVSLATIDTDGIIHAAPGTGGDVTITYTLPITGCKATLTIPVRPLPVPNITFNSGTVTLYADTGYKYYQWYGSIEGLIVGANSPTVAGLWNQSYYVEVTDSFGCVGTSALFPFNEHMGIADINNTNVSIFPNPATNVLYIKALQNLRAVITTIDGKAVIEQPNAKEVNISNLANGMYFIVLYNDDQRAIVTRKFVKQ